MSTDGVTPNSTDPNFDYHTDEMKDFEQKNIDKKVRDGAWGKVAAVDGNTLTVIFKADDTFHA